jgi:uncharacterized protein YciI
MHRSSTSHPIINPPMPKKYFAVRLLSRRPTFPADITPEERVVMKQHAGYWTDLMNQGKVLTFGPVLDPKGAYGLGIITVDSEEEIPAMLDNDPATVLTTYECYPMMAITPTSNS